MKKAYTLIELVFVIVIIGVLASVAIPKFTNLTKNAKSSGIKSVVTSVQASIDNIHGKWIIDDSMKQFKGADGNEHSLSADGYPLTLDANDGKGKLFSYVLKIPIPSCGTKTNGCWSQEDNVTYKYHFDALNEYQFRYDSSRGVLECNNSDSDLQKKCEKTVY